ncbi:transmembrane protein 72-like [Mercenaria mercenaria]|uniref:transmembrane protein 72-like n=1 Tax=Mercenaria mercenaria TaxID=6596 RepID=UPI001E1E0848|nr:transmembrane protein 72-like [Mercenaria mercenaria]
MGICYNICSSCAGDFFEWLCRIWGLATAVGLWGVGVETSYYGHYLGFYILTLAVLITLLESVFAITYCVDLCVSVDSRWKGCWDVVLLLDDWKKGVFYFALSIPCFIQPMAVWLAVIGGMMMILSGLFYVLKTFKTIVDKKRKTLAQTPSYDKFDEIQEEIDDDDEDDHVITQPGTMTIMDDDIGDQQEILEV